MIYPFMIMVSSSFESAVDSKEFSEIRLPERMPADNLVFQGDWLEFVRRGAGDGSLGLLTTCRSEFLEFARE